MGVNIPIIGWFVLELLAAVISVSFLLYAGRRIALLRQTNAEAPVVRSDWPAGYDPGAYRSELPPVTRWSSGVIGGTNDLVVPHSSEPSLSFKSSTGVYWDAKELCWRDKYGNKFYIRGGPPLTINQEAWIKGVVERNRQRNSKKR